MDTKEPVGSAGFYLMKNHVSYERKSLRQDAQLADRKQMFRIVPVHITDSGVFGKLLHRIEPAEKEGNTKTQKQGVNGLEADYRLLDTDYFGLLEHGIRVSNLAWLIAKRMLLSEEMCYNLAVAGFLHDIGKLEMTKYVNDPAESAMQVGTFRYVRTHSGLGYAILKEHGYPEEVLVNVLYHHENYDGTGYPSNLAGDKIPIGARILRVCDVYAALTENRRNQSAISREDAIRLMIKEVRYFDMQVFLSFMKVIHTKEAEDLLSLENLESLREFTDRNS